jgi:hypothetical protein
MNPAQEFNLRATHHMEKEVVERFLAIHGH